MRNLDTLTTAEVARLLGRDGRTVLRMVESGALTPAAKLPGRTGAYLFDRATIEALTAERAIEAGR